MYIDHGSYIELGGANIPRDEGNSDYRAYLSWLANGNAPSTPEQPSHAQLWERAITEMRRLRQPILDVLDGLQSSAVALKQEARATAIETAKQGLRDITKLDLSACTTFEEMGVAVLSAYAAIVSVLPSDVRAAFREVTQ
jgi:hypothetical protein